MGTDSAPEFVKIAVTVDTNNGAIVLYVNGEQKATATNSSADRTVDMYNTSQTFGDTTVSNTLCIGGDERSGNAQYFKGSIRSVAMYSGVRTDAQIALDYARSFYDTTESTLLFAHDLTTARDGFIEDKSANKNHANDKNWTAEDGRGFSSSDDILYPAKDFTEAPLTYEALIWAPLPAVFLWRDREELNLSAAGRSILRPSP